jgi:hypothetical protein
MTAKSTSRALKIKKAPEAKAEAAPKEQSHVIFRTSARQTHEFEVMGIRGIRGRDGRVTFAVPADKADSFGRHAHVTSGRVSRVG